jgi:cell division protein FtsN
MRQQQRGGTFLGIIIGVVVGLGAALAVAVYVTQVPVPFLNKSPARKPNQDAAEALKNKDWDPNAPLYGKNPAKTAAQAASAAAAASAPTPAGPPPVAGAASAARPAPGGDAVPSARTETKTEAKAAPAADPLGDLARSKSPGATVDPFTYYVQAGAFRTPEDAEGQRARLTLLGVEAKVTEREQSGRTVFRVRAGPFDTKDAADRVKERIDGGGMEAALVRVQR